MTVCRLVFISLEMVELALYHSHGSDYIEAVFGLTHPLGEYDFYDENPPMSSESSRLNRLPETGECFAKSSVCRVPCETSCTFVQRNPN